jgi:hypothetical protein
MERRLPRDGARRSLHELERFDTPCTGAAQERGRFSRGVEFDDRRVDELASSAPIALPP